MRLLIVALAWCQFKIEIDPRAKLIHINRILRRLINIGIRRHKAIVTRPTPMSRAIDRIPMGRRPYTSRMLLLCTYGAPWSKLVCHSRSSARSPSHRGRLRIARRLSSTAQLINIDRVRLPFGPLIGSGRRGLLRTAIALTHEHLLPVSIT